MREAGRNYQIFQINGIAEKGRQAEMNSGNTKQRLFTRPTGFQVTCLILLMGGFFILAIAYQVEEESAYEFPPVYTRISSELEHSGAAQR